MHATATQELSTGRPDQPTVREVLKAVRADGRTALSAPEAKRVCDAYGIVVPGEGLATSAGEAVAVAEQIGYPVVLKIVSPDILHKTEAKGVLVGVSSADDVSAGYETIVSNAKAYDPSAEITGVQVQEMLGSGQEVLIGAITDPTFGPVMTFGLGGVLVEVLRDVTFRLAPTTLDDALSMIGGIRAAEVLEGVRGGPASDRDALAQMIERVSRLVADFPEITEVDLNPVLASENGATAVDARLLVSFDPPAERPPLQPGADPGDDEPPDAPAGDRRDRRVGSGGKDRQLGDAQPSRRRVPRGDLSGQPQGVRDPGQAGLRRCRRSTRRGRRSGLLHPGQARG